MQVFFNIFTMSVTVSLFVLIGAGLGLILLIYFMKRGQLFKIVSENVKLQNEAMEKDAEILQLQKEKVDLKFELIKAQNKATLVKTLLNSY
jgi:hypothetical protein